ncbi:unnamed protein product [Aphanomyces euteiches]|uniref:RxLR effector protein n=1 Tax=Aphanomyces euteiches TaxID=100861 RepID=A0A6G0W8Q6_9STRA|nr:hypothetical protein Ae201684_017455 [Aphanomyces euteiches]KAH9085859.1 hypothetical protein Ae201684P_005557 [Aphanomyces euteiches]KAH9104749.1 hypothetical protein LEN26_014905 [Aphanomyces euteiches]KAH9117201.1 hypothetical protein AeMF1_008992 [Aphanomyces euteiches]KAH9154750.1 hypothetical protein AeRB84_003193 [Aphanomyces euteiches]
MRATSILVLCLVLFAAIFAEARSKHHGENQVSEEIAAQDAKYAKYVPDDNTRHQLYQEYSHKQQQGAKRQSFKSFLKKGLKVGWKIGKFAMGFRRLRGSDE